MNKNNVQNVFLNASIIDSAKLLMRFPTISKNCKSKGIDITRNPIPVAPAAHYFMGGIKATVEGKTSVRGLYAIGETASTGLHGANRLASNSLLECVVCAYELADYLSFANLETPRKIDNSIMDTINQYSAPVNEEDYDIRALKQKLKSIMWDYVGIVRSEESLKTAENMINDLIANFKRYRKCISKEEYEYRNMLTTASLVTKAALLRQESRGAHSRSDYKITEDVGKHSIMIKSEKKELSYVK